MISAAYQTYTLTLIGPFTIHGQTKPMQIPSCYCLKKGSPFFLRRRSGVASTSENGPPPPGGCVRPHQ